MPVTMLDQGAKRLPDETVEIPLTQGKVALVDERDLALVAGFNWIAARRGKNWYAHAYVRGTGRRARRFAYMHRVVLGLVPGEEVDHIDGDGLNNRRSNLRACTHAENQCNIHDGRSRFTLYKGVSFSRRDGRWVAQIHWQGRHYHLGTFDNSYDAACEYDIAALGFFGQFANVNFPWIWDDATCR